LILQNTSGTDELFCTLLSSEDTQVMIEICDLQGREIIQKQTQIIKGANDFQFDFKNISRGIYFIRIYNPHKQLIKKYVNTKK